MNLKRGLKVEVTYKHDFDDRLVNGTTVVVRDLHGFDIELDTAHGIQFIWRRYGFVSEPPGRSVRRGTYDLRYGYACTVHKAGVATVEQLVIVFEQWSCAGWGCIAVSRARRGDNIKVLGQPRASHFNPRE